MSSNGHAGWQRWPRLERPHRRAILVDAPVSSIKTRRLGSRSDWLLSHANRRRATSGRSCSAACAVSFKADPLALEEIPDRRRPHRDLTPLRQADIRAPINQGQNKPLMGGQLRAARLALLACGDLARGAITPIPSAHRRDTNTEPRSCLARRQPAAHRRDHPNPKILL